MAAAKIKRPVKPTVFLSHSSANRRELLALKRLVDERAGGLIEFFLSSDDDSIAHGTIWPAEVRAALDRMSLMLIFVSSEALKSGWTYFEAGYGLHKLNKANIYCLPGTDKAALPSPFNILQNRNLHSAREVGLLLRQVNEALDSKLNESVTKEDYDRIFKKPSLGTIQTGPSFEQLVESVTIEAFGPPEGLDVFARVCRARGLPVSTIPNDAFGNNKMRCSTGVKMALHIPWVGEMEDEFDITDQIRKTGEVRVRISGNRWLEWDAFNLGTTRTLAQLEAHNAEIRKRNDETQRQNAERQASPRSCKFTLSPINVVLPISTVDHWLDEVNMKKPLIAKIELLPIVECEVRAEAVSAKIHGSQLSLRDDGTLLWAERITVELCSRGNRTLTLTASDTTTTKLSQFQIPELVSTLFELNVLSLPSQRGSKRK